MKNSTWCLLWVECFVRIWEQTATIALYVINWLVFITVVESVYSAVRTDSLYKTEQAFVSKRLRQKWWGSQWNIAFVTWKEAIQLGLLYNQPITSYDLMVNPYHFQLTYRFNTMYTKIQGDQKAFVHLMITIQKVTSNIQSVPPPVSRHLLTPQIIFSNTVFSAARSTFRMYSVIAILYIVNFIL
jgi:hypothetical protein